MCVSQGLNEKKTLPSLRMLLVLMNLAEYMENLALEGSGAWGNLIPLFETFFRKLVLALPENVSLSKSSFSGLSLLHVHDRKRNRAALLFSGISTKEIWSSFTSKIVKSRVYQVCLL